MHKKNTKVSVILPSYNHAKFIEDAILSVFQQDYSDYEFIICDDASTDNSVQIIQRLINEYSSNKVELIVHDVNNGAVLTLNDLISFSKGEYIALINSDDIWSSEKLGQQVRLLESNPSIGAVFTHAELVDEKLRKINIPNLNVFITENQKPGQWLRDFFFNNNSLCHSSILIRREVYNDLGLYDPRFRQLPDFEYWVRLLKSYEIFIIQQPMVKFRLHEYNTSKVSMETRNLNNFELSIIMRTFFSDISNNLFIDGFSEHFRNREANSYLELECEKAFLFITTRQNNQALFVRLGIEYLYSLMKNPAAESLLRLAYNFSYEELQQLASHYQKKNNNLLFIIMEKTLPIGKKILVKIPFLNNLAKKIWRKAWETYE